MDNQNNINTSSEVNNPTNISVQQHNTEEVNVVGKNPQTLENQTVSENVKQPLTKSKFDFAKYTGLMKNIWMKLNPQIRKVLAITGFIFGLLLILAIVFSISTQGSRKEKQTPIPQANTDQSPLPEIIINPSRYATDSGVLSIEENIKIIEKKIGETVINDLKLSQPNLLWDIDFED